MRSIFILLISSLLFACSGGEENTKQIPLVFNQLKDSLKKVNKYINKKEAWLINSYIQRHGYKMETSGSGLRYYIYKSSNGRAIKSGDKVAVFFKIELLDGTECYNNFNKSPKIVTVENEDVERGIHEVLRLLKVGEKCICILPPHLAFGLIGDSNKIPPLSTVVYDLEIKGIEE